MRRIITRRVTVIVILLLLIVYGAAYLRARRSHLLIHAVGYESRMIFNKGEYIRSGDQKIVVAHTIRPRDPGIPLGIPSSEIAGVIFWPLMRVEEWYWDWREPSGSPFHDAPHDG